MEVEGGRARHRHLALEADEGAGPLDGLRRPDEARVERRRRRADRRCRRGPRKARSAMPRTTRSQTWTSSAARLGAIAMRPRSAIVGRSRQPDDAPRAPHQLPARSRSSRCASRRRCSARISAARSSARTASSASIASSFISGATSCPENFAHEKRAVKRDVARRLTSRSAKMRCRYSSGASDGRRGRPYAAERPLHACVGGDHRACAGRLRAQVVERLVEDVGEGRSRAAPATARGAAGARGRTGTTPRRRSRRARGRPARAGLRTAARSGGSPGHRSRAAGSGRSARRSAGAAPRRPRASARRARAGRSRART